MNAARLRKQRRKRGWIGQEGEQVGTQIISEIAESKELKGTKRVSDPFESDDNQKRPFQNTRMSKPSSCSPDCHFKRYSCVQNSITFYSLTRQK